MKKPSVWPLYATPSSRRLVLSLSFAYPNKK
jgi:hypothetical protein